MPKAFVRRGRLEVINEILSLCQTPTQKTHILYRCNLSYQQLSKYLNYLISSDLLAFLEEDGRGLYQITEKGKLFLKEFERIKKFIRD